MKKFHPQFSKIECGIWHASRFCWNVKKHSESAKSQYLWGTVRLKLNYHHHHRFMRSEYLWWFRIWLGHKQCNAAVIWFTLSVGVFVKLSTSIMYVRIKTRLIFSIHFVESYWIFYVVVYVSSKYNFLAMLNIWHHDDVCINLSW